VACVIVNVGGGSGGKQLISGAVVTTNALRYLQWGTGAGTAAVADTGLFSTSTTTEARTAGTLSQVTGAQTNSKFQIVGTITATGGNFGIHADHGSTVLASGDSIAYTVQIDITP
jgi:hypothetical protein